MARAASGGHGFMGGAAILECLQALREAIWSAYGPQVQQAWRDQLVPDRLPPNYDPDSPF